MERGPTRPETHSFLASVTAAPVPPTSSDPILSYIAGRAASGGGSGSSGALVAPHVESWRFQFAEVTVERRLGGGSFGQVFLARLHESPIALKVLLDAQAIAAQSSGAVAVAVASSGDVASVSGGVLAQEVGIMASLRHPNVSMFLGFCLDPPCIASEYCTRGSLLDVLRAAADDPAAAKELTWPRTIDMALGGATGMLHLHTRSPQVIHRDLKSPNLLVAADWTVKVRARSPFPPLTRFLCAPH